ncbi:MAG: hypothetical protein PHP86_10645 [Nevskiales bacterium]|nr:hypothetical protein [Nevskiales bacterium]
MQKVYAFVGLHALTVLGLWLLSVWLVGGATAAPVTPSPLATAGFAVTREAAPDPLGPVMGTPIAPRSARERSRERSRERDWRLSR